MEGSGHVGVGQVDQGASGGGEVERGPEFVGEEGAWSPLAEVGQGLVEECRGAAEGGSVEEADASDEAAGRIADEGFGGEFGPGVFDDGRG